MPESGSDTTLKPSADTVAVPLITSLPVVWSKLSTLSLVPGAALNTFGKLTCTGVVNAATPGAWMVMSKVCCSTPAGSMSRTSSGGTVAMPTLTSCSALPSSPMAAPGCTVSVSAARCCSVSAGAALASSTVITVGWLLLTSCSTLLPIRGRYTSRRSMLAVCESMLPIVPIRVLTTAGRKVAAITISGQNTPLGALLAVRPSTATFTSPAGTLASVKLPSLSV